MGIIARAFPAGPSTLLVAAVTAQPCLYAAVWFYPHRFKECAVRSPLNLLGGHAVDVFSKLVLGLKAVQVTSLLAWLERGLLPVLGWGSLTGSWAVLDAVRSGPPSRWAAALTLLGLGQSLNLGIYAAIGHDGVYYGFKLGRAVPWATGFPFNLGLRHPQYVGSWLSWAGLMLLFLPDRRAAAPAAVVLSLFGGAYLISAKAEAIDDADVNEEH
mmetsp:Transcript_159865/g.282000  ORF Transcript_159865/g.282000 Transcript_159865/m.282000 type:complete len:214 (-) Transcript_159865:8-649(-)